MNHWTSITFKLQLTEALIACIHVAKALSTIALACMKDLIVVLFNALMYSFTDGIRLRIQIVIAISSMP